MFRKFKSLFRSDGHDIAIEFEDQMILLDGRQFSLNRAKYADIDEMLELERSIYAGETPWDRMAFLSELRKTDLSLYLVLRDGSRLVGFIGCWFTKNESHITNIAIASAYQNQGIGRFLMQYMINMARSFGSFAMTLEVRTNNDPAKHLYHSLGFTDGKVKRGYYVMDHADAMDMRLDLTADFSTPEENNF
ncbi:ribosomal-protein-alanine acetyltransferase [Agrilactobacillus composti DSM 18527 = JCM 14202]|uniref:Ribosomal-protein-alanine acetyltransferase n=1 Tax=Agrilactobacillus composti DSM 18527 = JCM 14202 TaxID=1423734 RepID=X0PQC3_9LACO|nr:ribosomal protein S18-alanine N-acetyltransferase [Agrilactobacillus composti]KRM32500.1 ribosomal-protein-alanine acetyltransferase [Agrilactobacillus composti DSM 18527 = JCM 14202]GAF39937.1 ribosomal-protein-S18p-alanine acetyltransferase [Agrilactobacillus composti DSM 18527 = JCM 14202]